MQVDKIVGEIINSNKTLIKIAIIDIKEVKKIDIRTYFKSFEGEWIPTKKGCTIPLDKKQELIDLINSI